MSFIFSSRLEGIVSIKDFCESLNFTSDTVRSFAKGVEDVLVVFWVLKLSTSLV